jgi:DNA ligase-1
MLAHTLDDAHRKHARFPCYSQPKLDGVRMMASLAEFAGAPPALYSRTGKPFAHLLPYFRGDLAHVAGLMGRCVLDGELYVHGAGFQTIVSLAKNTKRPPEVGSELRYHVYDVLLPDDPGAGYDVRLAALAAALPHGNIVPVETHAVHREAEVQPRLARYEKEGYEGLVLRDRAAPYAAGKRSNALLKLKSFSDAEFLVVGVEEATGKDAGTAVFVCETTAGGPRFRVRPHGTHAERAQLLRRAPSDIVGKKQLTVRYQELTDGGVPRFPVGVAVRDYE